MLLFFSYEKIFEQFHVVQLFDENFGMQILIAYSINLNYFLLSYQKSICHSFCFQYAVIGRLTLSAFKLSTIYLGLLYQCDGQYNIKYFFKTKLNTKVAVLCQCTLLNMTIFIFSVSTDNECSQILSQKMTSTPQIFIAVKILKQEIRIRTR